MKRIAIIISEGFEEVECITCIDILRRSGLQVEVFGIADSNVTGAHGVTIICDEVFDYYTALDFDGIVLVGGMKNAITLSESKEVLDLIENYYYSGKLVAGICATPSIVFSKTNICESNILTCYPSEDLIKNISGNFEDRDVIISNNLITSQSPSTAMDFALTIVKYFSGSVDELMFELKGKN